MSQYHKIQGLYKRNMDKVKTIKCGCDNGNICVGMSLIERPIYEKCFNCKGSGKIVEKNPNYGKFIIGQYSKPEFELLKDIQWAWTEKVDGTNIRVCIYTNPLCKEIEFKGKTDRAEIPEHLLKKLKTIFTHEKVFSVFEIGEEKPDVYLYGEGYGYKIQSGSKYFINPNDVDFILFDIRIGNWWLKRETLEEVAEKLGIDIVPLIGKGTIDEAIAYIKSKPKSRFGFKNFVMEGLVIKPEYGLYDRAGRRIITKIKYRDFKEK